jgi:hypothetical protein
MESRAFSEFDAILRKPEDMCEYQKALTVRMANLNVASIKAPDAFSIEATKERTMVPKVQNRFYPEYQFVVSTMPDLPFLSIPTVSSKRYLHD